MNSEKTLIVRHFLATIAYRFQKALRGAPSDFAVFDAGSGVRSPAELIRHMTRDLISANHRLTGKELSVPQPLTWERDIERFHGLLQEIDDALAQGDSPGGNTLELLLQGPFADVMTHIGQLAMLRRLAGSPVPGENFRLAEITTGKVGSDQPEARKPLTD